MILATTPEWSPRTSTPLAAPCREASDLDSLPPQVRRELLRVLHGTSAERAHVIGRLFERPEGPSPRRAPRRTSSLTRTCGPGWRLNSCGAYSTDEAQPRSSVAS